ncbi:MAG: hypothetical protein LBC98_10310 [Prevotellaceae bacterium]|jgi:hypothetical protein|nr:hypothetical protein [Prevotellaceae bacterium]
MSHFSEKSHSSEGKLFCSDNEKQSQTGRRENGLGLIKNLAQFFENSVFMPVIGSMYFSGLMKTGYFIYCRFVEYARF